MNRLFLKYFIILLISGSIIYICYRYNVAYCDDLPMEQYLVKYFTTLPYPKEADSPSLLLYQTRVFEDVFQTIDKQLLSLDYHETLYRQNYSHSEDWTNVIESFKFQRARLNYYMREAQECQNFIRLCFEYAMNYK